MSSSLAVSSQVLPVSIVSGPSSPALLQKIGATDPKGRLGLLTSSPAGKKKFIVEQLSSSHEGHGHDPAQILEQIIAIADKGVVDHLILECDSETPAIAFASLFLPREDSANRLAE